ncbi:unnamed protein product [Rotaria sp. Silwood2]|nr:unnamed protein product [Rotaria sp. Silwood2]CAF2844176.1 unnamed protein product [Rotaria sp. Silwood2]CAF2970216.1 unnamed protein product [Rotaria sp. Silwood2]CAF3362977.1 unnamed protein product [Rotaria sp. Silwood2]CAF4022667.1 unnamed protein product [Rotaria sp. Silwood2]
MWKAGDTPWEENTDWKPYLDIENHILEQGFQENKSTVELDGYYCDLEKYIQMNKKDPNKQRPIKRISSVDINKRFRSKQRYILQKPELKPELAALGWTSAWSRFLLAAGVFSVIKNEELTERVEKAADGILEEGIKHDKQIEGKWIANELRKVKDEDRTIIGLCCVKLFTIESFLYPLLNEVLRESEVQNTGMECVHEFTTELGKSQGRTLGPFCSLLWFYLYENPSQRLTYIYRTASLTEKNINDYEKHKGEWMVWIDFSIATKSKTNALNSQENTIYEIKVRDGGVPGVIDVSTLSGYPSENEVLIIAGIPYEIKAINYDDQLKKYFIHIEL